jgi:hypothetical protein
VDVKLRADDAATAPDGAKLKPAANGQTQSRAPPQGSTSQQTQSLEETLHTTAKHPFLTEEQGWVQAGQLQPGMHVIRADGSIGVVEALQVIPGAGTRYDLEVSNVHTFEVGLGQWVVHNCNFSQLADQQAKDLAARGIRDLRARNSTAVAVGFFEDQEGNIQRLVSTARGRAARGIRRLLSDPNELVVGTDHAERNIGYEAENRGWKLLGMGSSIRACFTCGIYIRMTGGEGAIGTEVRDLPPRTGTIFTPLWRRFGL